MKKRFGQVTFFALLLILVANSGLVALAAEPNFGGVPEFRRTWVQQDQLVGTSGSDRPYTWGPNVPDAPIGLSETYKESPGGQRRVLYLDKARMEINNPASGLVTTGLAVKELVSGQRQDGDNSFTSLTPSKTQVAGDPVAVNPDAPVYASFNKVVTLGNADGNSKPSAVGNLINRAIDKAGQLSTIIAPEPIKIGAYIIQTGHNVAEPFIKFQYQLGTVTDPNTGATRPNQPVYTTDPTSNVFGLPISEPYWVRTRIAGVERIVLVQLFERRVLTYNPALNANKVEMGNLGQHYYQWRYVETTTPGIPNFSGTWKTNFATVTLEQRGDKISGSFARYGEAESQKRLLSGTVKGRTLTGYSNIEVAAEFSLTLSPDGQSFDGKWNNLYQWCGVKKGALPTGCGFSGSWQTNFASLKLTQDGDSVSGDYKQYGETLSTNLKGNILGTSGVPVLLGYWGGEMKNYFRLDMNQYGTYFNGTRLKLQQWCGVRNGPLPDGCGWSGKWLVNSPVIVEKMVGNNVNNAIREIRLLTAKLVQTGDDVTGTISLERSESDSISLNGKVTAWTVAGKLAYRSNVLDFSWTQVDLGQLPQSFEGYLNGSVPSCGYREGGSFPKLCLA